MPRKCKPSLWGFLQGWKQKCVGPVWCEKSCGSPVIMKMHFTAMLPPFPFGHICLMVLVIRKGGESSWSGPWHLGYTLEVFHVHSYQDQFIQPGWSEFVFLWIFCLGLCFVCPFVLFDLFVSPFFCVSLGSWAISLQFLALA